MQSSRARPRNGQRGVVAVWSHRWRVARCCTAMLLPGVARAGEEQELAGLSLEELGDIEVTSVSNHPNACARRSGGNLRDHAGRDPGARAPRRGGGAAPGANLRITQSGPTTMPRRVAALAARSKRRISPPT